MNEWPNEPNKEQVQEAIRQDQKEAMTVGSWVYDLRVSTPIGEGCYHKNQLPGQP